MFVSIMTVKSYINKCRNLLNGMENLSLTTCFVSSKILALSLIFLSVYPTQSLDQAYFMLSMVPLAKFTPLFMFPVCLYDSAFLSLPDIQALVKSK